MTNLFAVKFEYRKQPHLFCVSDSQVTMTSDQTKSSSSQKLAHRGRNLIMYTGLTDIAQSVYEQLPHEDMPPHTLAEQIMRITEPVAKQFEGKEHASTVFFIAGPNGKAIEMYDLAIIENEKYSRRINTIHSNLYSGGGGSRHVVPAINRDQEKGYIIPPTNPLEALLLCFGVGAKADTDLGVNEKLQIGIMTPKTTRLLFPPGINFKSWESVNQYFAALTGVQTSYGADTPIAKKDGLDQLARTVNEFYHALQTQFYRVLSKDFFSNTAHTNLKEGKATLKEYQAYLALRKKEVKHTKPLVNALMSGDVRKIVAAVRKFHKREETFLKAAEAMAPK